MHKIKAFLLGFVATLLGFGLLGSLGWLFVLVCAEFGKIGIVSIAVFVVATCIGCINAEAAKP